eukprot:CAMPEP_0182420778 /NCGR_PEP_ID=MMETSP1167-20130531/5842_1 /TAXON_ID=2988 /ORGANISM="Mallomonas Sp, Strain CCMP3275" /LENGTH=669 /DNA_ID=CAMNT_0024597203 /DNA_START=38 /DNA_END=2047 /DNA_ORIENTATION=+
MTGLGLCINVILVVLLSTKAEEHAAHLRPFSSPEWSVLEGHDLPKNHLATFYVHMKLRNEDQLTADLISVSDPESSEYGNHFTMQQINEKYSPLAEDVDKVTTFFNNIENVEIENNLQRNFLKISAQVEHIENALGTTLQVHHNEIHKDAKIIRAVQSLNIPDDVSTLLSFVSLTTPVSHIVPMAVEHQEVSEEQMEKEVNLGSFTGATPEVSQRLYKIENEPQLRMGSQSFAAFYGQFFNPMDIKAMFQYANLPMKYAKLIPNENIFGTIDNRADLPGRESSLDVQTLMSTAPGVPTYMYSMIDLNPYNYANEGFLAYVQIVGNQENPPLIHSISYGDDSKTIFDADSNKEGNIQYGNAVDQEFKLMGLRGLSVIFASGDSGVGGLAFRRVRCEKTWPVWPASSPYITAVGGTKLGDSGEEEVCSIDSGGTITGGGGFSTVSNRADDAPWQVEAVDGYLSKYASQMTGIDKFNAKGRGYPDVSVLAHDFPVLLYYSIVKLSGTSASAPLFAGMIALINDLRLKAGKSPMGFLNPFLYWVAKNNPSAYNDITKGHINCGIMGDGCCPEGFPATPGWDAATGLGSINYPEFKKMAVDFETTENSESVATASPTKKPKNKNKKNKRRRRNRRRRNKKPKNPKPVLSSEIEQEDMDDHYDDDDDYVNDDDSE